MKCWKFLVMEEKPMQTNNINLLSLLPGTYKKVASTRGGEYHGSCPFCGGRDRFIVQPHSDKPSWYCRQCERKGDAIAFVMQYEGVDFKEALERLNMADEYKPRRSFAPSKPAATPPAPVPALDNQEYRQKSAVFAEWAWKQLFSGNYPEIETYLTGRGLSEQLLDIYQIGYNPRDFKRTWGGVDVWLPQGIVIPWLYEETPVKLRIRLEDTTRGKYTQAKGGANWLYNVERVKPSSVVVLVESELDALSIQQAFNHHNVAALATGGTTGARLLRWQALLMVARVVLIAFDTDQAGETASAFWLSKLPNAKRLAPLAHDVNDMLTGGHDIQSWIMEAV